ncbi:MAG: hypothetical protein ACLTTQ_00720 [Christensenellales bacterium]
MDKASSVVNLKEPLHQLKHAKKNSVLKEGQCRDDKRSADSKRRKNSKRPKSAVRSKTKQQAAKSRTKQKRG